MLTPPSFGGKPRVGNAYIPGHHRSRAWSQPTKVNSDANTISFPGIDNTEGGYTPFEFVSFTDQLLKHEISIDVAASPEECYEAWKDPKMLASCFEFVTDYTDLTDDATEGEPATECAGMTVMYKLGTYPTLQLKFEWSRVDDVPGRGLGVQSDEGMPMMASVEFDADESGSTKNTFKICYSMPRQLGLFEDPLVVHRNMDMLLNQYMKNVKAYIE